jgi:hypothetical protein
MNTETAMTLAPQSPGGQGDVRRRCRARWVKSRTSARRCSRPHWRARSHPCRRSDLAGASLRARARLQGAQHRRASAARRALDAQQKLNEWIIEWAKAQSETTLAEAAPFTLRQLRRGSDEARRNVPPSRHPRFLPSWLGRLMFFEAGARPPRPSSTLPENAAAQARILIRINPHTAQSATLAASDGAKHPRRRRLGCSFLRDRLSCYPTNAWQKGAAGWK